MSGSEVKTPELIEDLMGFAPENDCRVSPSPTFGALSLFLPVFGLGLGWLIGSATQRQDGSGAAWVPMTLLWTMGLTMLASVVGLGFATYSLWRLERWPLMASVAVVVDGGLLLTVLSRMSL